MSECFVLALIPNLLYTSGMGLAQRTGKVLRKRKTLKQYGRLSNAPRIHFKVQSRFLYPTFFVPSLPEFHNCNNIVVGNNRLTADTSKRLFAWAYCKYSKRCWWNIIHRVPEKSKQKCFCHIFYKTWRILV